MRFDIGVRYDEDGRQWFVNTSPWCVLADLTREKYEYDNDGIGMSYLEPGDAVCRHRIGADSGIWFCEDKIRTVVVQDWTEDVVMKPDEAVIRVKIMDDRYFVPLMLAENLGRELDR